MFALSDSAWSERSLRYLLARFVKVEFEKRSELEEDNLHLINCVGLTLVSQTASSFSSVECLKTD